MELDSFLLALDAVEGDPPGLHRDCKRCNRPCSVCVCYSLPPSRLGSKARLIVLQHPHEIRRRLATVPLLSAALEKVDVPRGRRFDGDLRCPPCLREAMAEAEQKKIPVLLMFPGPGALDVKEVAERGIPRWVVEGRESAEEEEEEGERRQGGGGAGEEEEKEAATTTTTATEEGESKSKKPSPPLAFGPVRGGEYILVAVDGTWHQGKQMFRDLAPWFLAPRGPAIRVQLPIGDAAEELSEEAAAAVARAEEERRAAAAAAAANGNGSCGNGNGGNGDTSTAAAAATAAEAATDVTRNICADTRTIALFKEPFEGCMTTAEAIARALAELEPSPAPAAAVLSALNAVVDSQKRHDPAVRARCGLEEEEVKEGKNPTATAAETQGAGGEVVESWHKKLHERRERKRAARAAKEAAAAGVPVADAAAEARRRRDEEKKKLYQNKNGGKKGMSASGLAESRKKFGFKNPPSNSCAECVPQRPPLLKSAEERAARKAEKLAARIESRVRRQAAEAAAGGGAVAAVAAGGAGEAEG